MKLRFLLLLGTFALVLVGVGLLDVDFETTPPLSPQSRTLSLLPSPPSPPQKADVIEANRRLRIQAQNVLSIAHQISTTAALRDFVVHPTVQFAQRSFTSNDLEAQQLDLVIICNQRLRPMLATAYDRNSQSPALVDPEIKLSLSNHPIFTHLSDQPVALIKTFRGTMLLAYLVIESNQSPQPAGYLIVGRLLTPDTLHGAHIEMAKTLPAKDSILWPDIFGRPVFALN